MSDPAAAGPSSINGASSASDAAAGAKKSTKEMTKAERRELQVRVDKKRKRVRPPN
jgi:hypothetical protein